MGCAARYPDRVRAIFPSNIAGGVICDAYLATKLYRSIDLTLNQGMQAVVAAFDREDRFAPFVSERVQDDPGFRKDLEAMPPEEYAQVMPGNNDIHPRRVADLVHRLIPNAQWGEVPPHAEAPEKYVQRVLQFLAEVGSGTRS